MSNGNDEIPVDDITDAIESGERAPATTSTTRPPSSTKAQASSGALDDLLSGLGGRFTLDLDAIRRASESALGTDRFFEATVDAETLVPERRRGAVVVPEAPAGGEPIALRPERVAETEAGALMEQFVALSREAPEAFTGIQAGLWATGMLSIGKNKFVNIAGLPEENTRQAFSRLMEEVLARREQGEDVTLEDLVAELDARVTPELVEDLAGGGGAGRGGGGVTLSDPKGLLVLLEQKAEQLGLDPDRVVTDDVARTFIAAIHDAQRGFAHGLSSGAEATQVSPEARAREFIEERFGVQVDRAERVEATRTSQDAFNDAADVISQMVGRV